MPSHDERELESMYGPAARFSEHHRGDRVVYMNGKGQLGRGVIIWVQARFENIPVKYVVDPDNAPGHVDFILPGAVISAEEQQQTLVRCVWCGQHHEISQVKHCPMRPKWKRTE